MTGAGVRATRQRTAITQLLDSLDEFRSAQELHDELRRRGENIGLTTVYRTLKLLESAGLAQALVLQGETRFERELNRRHHDHFICSLCGSIFEFTSDEIESPRRESSWKY